jgi:hypothetical protein
LPVSSQATINFIYQYFILKVQFFRLAFLSTKFENSAFISPSITLFLVYFVILKLPLSAKRPALFIFKTTFPDRFSSLADMLFATRYRNKGNYAD